MAIDLKFKFQSVDFANQKFILVDNTGMETPANLGGYGLNSSATNASKIEADRELIDFLIDVTRPDATTINKNINNIEFIDPITPTIAYETIEIGIDNTKKIENGLYSFKFTVYEQGGELGHIIVQQYIYDTDTLEKKINAKFASDLNFCKNTSCECNKSLLTLWSYYRALKAAIDVQNAPRADYISAQILKILE